MNISRDSAITLSTFLVLVVALYFVGFWLIFRLERATPLMLSVGVATILTCLIRKRSLASLGWGWGSWKYQWTSYLVPLLYVSIAYALIWIFGFGQLNGAEFLAEQKQAYNLGNWNDFSTLAFHFLITATFSFIMLLPSVLGEEIAWRGFLVPEFSKFMSFTGTSLVSGFLWSLFHWPLMFAGFYGNQGTPLAYQLTMFTTFIVSISFIMTYLRFKTNSLWTAVIFHMSANIFLQKFFAPLTAEVANSAWYLDEFGAVVPAVTFVFAVYFWRKGVRELSGRRIQKIEYS